MKLACPNCGGTDVQYHYGTRTAMYWPHIYHDGVLEDNDPNISTEYYTCCKCHHKFYIKAQHGDIIECEDQGRELIVPVIEADLTAGTSVTAYVPQQASTAIGIIDLNNSPVRAKYQWEVDIEELQKEVASIKESLARLDKDLHLIKTLTFNDWER